MLKYVVFASLVPLLGCGAPGAAETPSDEATPDAVSLNAEDFSDLEAAYGRQQLALQRDLGDSVFVASYRGLVQNGRLITFSIWTDSVPTALPKTQFVWLQDAKMSRWFVVAWSDLEAAIGNLPSIEGTEPPRYLTPANIPASYFSQLEQAFVAPEGFPERLAAGRR